MIKKVRKMALSVEEVEEVQDFRGEHVGSDQVHGGINIKVKGEDSCSGGRPDSRERA